MISITLDISGVTQALREFSDKVNTSLEIAMDVAGREIVEAFRADQLSGRRAPNYGLNRRTGNLYESLRSGVTGSGKKLTSEIYNRGAQYWYYHEFGMGYNPKRLWFEETFRKTDIYQTNIEKALAGAV